MNVGTRVVYAYGHVGGWLQGPVGTILKRRREAPRFLVRFDDGQPFPGVLGQEQWCDPGQGGGFPGLQAVRVDKSQHLNGPS